ncbi:MAG: hypothetical protein QM756_39755 [Polyangiaceae bacterium]
MRRWLALVACLLTLASSAQSRADAGGDEQPANVIRRALEAVQRGAYDDAVDQLEALADRGFVHPDASSARAYVYVERARSRAKHSGDSGRAIAALEETQKLQAARTLEPKIAALQSEISRQRAREGNAPVLQRPTLGRAITSLLPENAWAALAALGSTLVTAGLLFYLFVKRRSSEIAGATAIVVGLLLGGIGSCLTLGARHYRKTSRAAVVVVGEARLLGADGRALQPVKNQPTAIPEGSLVYVREQGERFAHVEWGSVEGWLDPSQLQLLATLD